MFLPQLIISLVFLLGGLLMAKYPPKKINPLYGYRTKRSMQSADAWKYAQRLSSRKMILCGLFGLLIFVAASILDCSEGVFAILMLTTLVLTVVYVFSSVERNLKNKFPDVRS